MDELEFDSIFPRGETNDGFAQYGPSPRILDTVLVDYAAVGSVAARRAS